MELKSHCKRNLLHENGIGVIREVSGVCCCSRIRLETSRLDLFTATF
jgi:hypothetical protein